MNWHTWILAGDAVFTVELPEQLAHRHQPHYTYRVQHAEANGSWPEVYFVKLLVGPDNTSDYVNFGRITVKGEYLHSRKSIHREDSFPVRLFRRVWERVKRGESETVERAGFLLHHEGRCGCCGRALTTPESCERGIGPVCWERYVLESKFGRGATAESVQAALTSADR